jgi:hypothetical protein
LLYPNGLEGGFAVHSGDPNARPIEGATHEGIESHFAEKVIAFVGKHFMPELSQASAAQAIPGILRHSLTERRASL